MTMEQMDSHVRDIILRTARSFIDLGQMPAPTLFCWDADEDHAPAIMQWHNLDNDVLHFLVAGSIATICPQACAFVSDTWVKRTEDKEESERVHRAGRFGFGLTDQYRKEDLEEALTVIAFDREWDTPKFWQQVYSRRTTEGGEEVIEWENIIQARGADGRLTDIMIRAFALANERRRRDMH